MRAWLPITRTATKISRRYTDMAHSDLKAPAAASEGPVFSSRRVLIPAAQSATARKSTLLVTIMQVSPKRSTSWPDSKVPTTKAAEPAPLTHPY